MEIFNAAGLRSIFLVGTALLYSNGVMGNVEYETTSSKQEAKPAALSVSQSPLALSKKLGDPNKAGDPTSQKAVYQVACKAIEHHMENFGNLTHNHAVHPLLQESNKTIHDVSTAFRTGENLHHANQWKSDLTVQLIQLREANISHLDPSMKQRVEKHKEHLQKLASALGHYHAETLQTQK